MKQFIKKEGLQLLNGGYLSNMEGNPVYNEGFVTLQKHAEYICTFAELAKTKDFVGKKADSLEALRKEVNDKLYSKEKIVFVDSPKKIKRKITDELSKEALAFINYQKDVSKVDKINNFLQQFSLLKEFEDFGLFFTDDIVKLNKIYTIEEITNAVKETIDLL